MIVPGSTIEYAAFGWPDDHGMLPDSVRQLNDGLRSRLARAWAGADQDEQRRLLETAGCLNRLSGFLLQVSRIAAYAESLQRRPLTIPGTPIGDELPPGAAAALAATDICTDFESLLFHGRALLDRLTWMVSRIHGQRCDRFSKLLPVLRNVTGKDDRALRVVGHLDEVRGLDYVLVDVDGKKSLRSRVTHQSGIVEGTQRTFTIYRLLNGRYLMFDCEALQHPVLATTHRLAADVPFIVLNTLAIYFKERHQTLALSEFGPVWRNPTVVFSEHLDPSETGPIFGVARMRPDGFEFETRHLKTSVMDHAYP